MKTIKNKLRDERWYNRLHRWLESQSWYPFAFILVYSLLFSIAWTAIYQHVFGYKFDICYILTSKFFVVVACAMFYTMLYRLIKIKQHNWSCALLEFIESPDEDELEIDLKDSYLEIIE